MPGLKRSRAPSKLGHRRSHRATRLRKGKNRTAMVSVPRNKLGFPDRMRTKLRYTERLDFEPTGTTAVVNTFRGNGMYDPLFDTGGHQPRGFDDYMDVYGQFTVLASTISVNAMYEGYLGPGTKDTTGHLQNSVVAMGATGAPALSPACVFIRKTTDSGATYTGGFQKVLETDRTQWVFLTHSDGAKTLKASGKVRDFYGKEAQIGAVGYFGTENGDPTQQFYYQVGVARASDDYPTGACKVTLIVSIEYDCVFTEPKPLAAS